MRETGRASSSPGLSSPPTPSSPTYGIPPTQSRMQANTTSHAPANVKSGANLGGESVKVSGHASVDLVAKKPRKKRDPAATAKKQSDSKPAVPSSALVDGREVAPKTRKPRAPNGQGPKRKSKIAVQADEKVTPIQLPAQSKLPDSLASPIPGLNINAHTAPELSRIGNNEAIDIPQGANHNAPRVPTPRSSGQNYDPVRSSTIEPRSFPPTPSQQILRSSTPPRPSNYGIANNSPSISSLIDPPSAQPLAKREYQYKPLSPPAKRQRLTPPESISHPSLTGVAQQDIARESAIKQGTVQNQIASTVNQVSSAQSVVGHAATPMDSEQTVPPTRPAPIKQKSTTSTGTSTPANATKPPRQKEATMPIATGNGLLSTEMFGGASGSNGPEKTAPTVILDVPLSGEQNRYVNFARLAEERYGFNALYPRLAAQRERLARVAAAGAALEKENKANGSGMSGDDMSVDLSDGEGAGDDSNVEMGGMGLIERDVLGAGRSPAEGSEGVVVKRKKRVMKEDQYDKDDPFVDDTELAWEEQQAASKDGFFVYSGPLVPEGEKPNVERADGTTKRGRGTGRGRGGSTRGSRGGATRGRGGTTGPRKARITKAAKESMDQEKVQRESLAMLAAKPTTYPV